MLRKIILGLVTVASLSAMALAPTEASARAGGHGFGRGGGFGGHHFAGGGFGGHRHFGGGGFGRAMGVGLGVGLGLELIGAAMHNSCRTGVTPGGRTITVC